MKRYVQVSFTAGDTGVIAESKARNDILNQDVSVGGLGWELGQSNPMIVFRDFDDDAAFDAAIAELRERVGGDDFAEEVSVP
jgi:acyl-CoA reductase-like NAD-dependent aldehyde dehydrogenase